MNNNNVLRIHIKNSQPVDVSDFTKTMSAFGTLFSNFAQKNGKSKEEANAKLYVSKIIEGSIDIHLVELASLAVIPFVENSNLILDFAKHIKSIYDYFVLSKGDEPELNVPELKGVHDMVSIPANDRNGLMTVQVINDNAGNVIFEGCTFNHIEGNGIQNQSDNVLKERKALSNEGDIYRKQLMTIYQVRKDGTDRGNKGVIDAISDRKLGLVFDSDILEDEILRSAQNPMLKGYIVDVIVQTVLGKPAAYKIMALHDVIDLD
ncbi:MAG: hypothetical protein MST08_17880 [Parabacteroides distasonis]|nr:hypothetical protein [Parabacteroides distasonis]